MSVRLILMSLIKCKECQKEVSDMARFCVHCGYKERGSVFLRDDLAVEGTVFRFILGLGVSVFLVGLVVLATGGSGFTTAAVGGATMLIGMILLLLRSIG